MAFIFISHATTDDQIVTQIHDALESVDIDAWVDHIRGIQPGQAFDRAIADALTQCSAGVFVISRRSLASDECLSEWRRILDQKKPLYTVMIEHVPVENLLGPLRNIQYVNLTADFRSGMQTLIDTIRGGGGSASSYRAPEIQQPRTMNLTGRWQGHDNMLYDIQHNGNQIAMQMMTPFGQLVTQATGQIAGNQIQVTFQSLMDGTMGQAQFEVSPDGNMIRGMATNYASQITAPIQMMRIQ